MSPRHLRLYIAASATSLTLLAFVVAGISSSPSALLLAVVGLVPPIIYFFHQSACAGTPFDDLREGQAVSFTVGQGPKGPRAENVNVR